MSLISISKYRLAHPGLPSTLFRPGFQQTCGMHLYSLSSEELQAGSGPHVEISTHKNTEKPKLVIWFHLLYHLNIQHIFMD